MNLTRRLGILGLVILAATSACSSSSGGTKAAASTVSTAAAVAATTTTQPVDATDDAKITGCIPSQGSHGGIATVEVTNPTTKAATYHVALSFSLPNGTRFGAGDGAFESVPAGKSKTIPIISPAIKANVTKVTCAVISVKRSAP